MAIVRVKSVNVRGPTSATTIVSPAITIAAGNLVVVVVGWDTGSGQTLSGVADDLSVAGSHAVTAPLPSFNQKSSIYYFANHGGGSRTFTATFSATASSRAILVIEYSGAATSSVTDGSNSAGGTSATPSSGAVTPTQAGALFVGSCYQASGPLVAASPFGLVWDNSTDFGNIEDYIQGAAASQAAPWTSPNTEWAACVAVFKWNGVQLPVDLRSVGAWATYTADGTVAIPASVATGDLMILFATWKQWDTTATVSGWTEITEFNDGTVNAAANVGSNKVGAWYKEHDGSEADPTLDWSVAPVPGTAVIAVFSKISGNTWDAPTFTTAAIASATSWTATGAANLSLAAGDALVCLVGFRDDSATMTRSTTNLSATGITWAGDYVESPATHASTTASNDISADLGYRLVSSGTSSAAPTASGTLSASETGAALFLRLRSSAAGVALAGTSAAVSGSTSAIVRTRLIASTTVAVSGSTSALARGRPIASTTAAVSGSTSALARGRPIASTTAAVSGSTSALARARPIASTTAAVSGSASALARTRPIASTTAAVSGSTSALTVQGSGIKAFAGTSAAVSGSTSALARARRIASTTAAVSGSTSALARGRSVAATTAAVSGSTAVLVRARAVVASSIAVSGSTSVLARNRLLVGIISALSGSVSALTVAVLVKLGIDFDALARSKMSLQPRATSRHSSEETTRPRHSSQHDVRPRIEFDLRARPRYSFVAKTRRYP